MARLGKNVPLLQEHLGQAAGSLIHTGESRLTHFVTFFSSVRVPPS